MNDISAQIKQLQLIECQVHKQFCSQLSFICTQSECQHYLKLLCPDCIENHPNHDNNYFKGFKKIMIQLSDLYLKERQNNPNQLSSEEKTILIENQQNTEKLKTLAKDFKIIALECLEIYDLITRTLEDMNKNPAEQSQKFEVFLENINGITQQENLEQQILMFKNNIKLQNQVQLDFNNKISSNKQICNVFQNQLEAANKEFQQFQQKTYESIKSLGNFQLNNSQIPQELTQFFEQNIPNFKNQNIEQINAKFSNENHHTNCKIIKHCKINNQQMTFFHQIQDYWDYALIENPIEINKNIIQIFKLSCDLSNNSHVLLGITELTGAKNKKFYDAGEYSHFLSLSTSWIYDLNNERDQSGFQRNPNEITIVYCIFDGYQNCAYIVNSEDCKYAKFQPDFSKGNWYWSIAGNNNTGGDLYQLL